MREFERVIGVLLDQKHGEMMVLVKLADDVEYLLRDQRREGVCRRSRGASTGP
jgi:hypothetical protein